MEMSRNKTDKADAMSIAQSGTSINRSSLSKMGCVRLGK